MRRTLSAQSDAKLATGEIKDREKAALDSVIDFQNGKEACGLPWLRKFFNKKVAATIEELLRVWRSPS